ncbi:MAG: T9SS type A sorting domain-containing protein, partial [Prevotellaceae bacterium]|nr:T9SS type A sorting domain-containing protein [Prevotellaceae bacterium]
LGSDNSPVISPEARVWFYLIDPGSPTEAIQAAAMADGVGLYMATVPEGGTYIVGAENVPGHLTTYYAGGQGVTQSHQATLLTLSEGMPPITLRMTAIPTNIGQGSITIDGHVYDDGTLKAKVARNATVGIYYIKKGGAALSSPQPNPDDWELLRTVQPNEDAYFIVRNLPPGIYLVVADIPGYNLVGAYTLYAEDGGEFHDNNFFVNDYAQIITISDNPTSAPTQEGATFSLYPNPFADEVHVSGAEGSLLEVLNSAGMRVHLQKLTAPEETVSLKRLPAGLYFFRLEKGGKRQTVKTVKE